MVQYLTFILFHMVKKREKYAPKFFIALHVTALKLTGNSGVFTLFGAPQILRPKS